MAEKLYSEINKLKLPQGEYVLVLPGWYPTWLDPSTGDFNQRQVKAAGLKMPQLVLYIAKDQENKLTKTEVKFNQLTSNIAEILIVYPSRKIKLWDVLYSNLIYLKLLFKWANIIERKWGRPSLLHAYIVIRGGVGGWLLGRKWKLPFVLSEHWTIYDPADPGYFQNRNFLFRYIVKQVFKRVKKFLPVSESLHQQVKKLLPEVSSTVIPNVVDTQSFFYKQSTTVSAFQFIHISTMNYQKNPQGLLRAYKMFSDVNAGTFLEMVGPYPKEILHYARSIGLTEANIHFTGNIAYEEVAKLLQQSNALVLFSRYENLPCVILEALCCGVPVIATSVGGITEVINETNGLIVKSENEDELVDAFNKLCMQYQFYNRQQIAEVASNKFSYETVGDRINSVYEEIINL